MFYDHEIPWDIFLINISPSSCFPRGPGLSGVWWAPAKRTKFEHLIHSNSVAGRFLDNKIGRKIQNDLCPAFTDREEPHVILNRGAVICMKLWGNGSEIEQRANIGAV